MEELTTITREVVENMVRDLRRRGEGLLDAANLIECEYLWEQLPERASSLAIDERKPAKATPRAAAVTREIDKAAGKLGKVARQGPGGGPSLNERIVAVVEQRGTATVAEIAEQLGHDRKRTAVALAYAAKSKRIKSLGAGRYQSLTAKPEKPKVEDSNGNGDKKALPYFGHRLVLDDGGEHCVSCLETRASRVEFKTLACP